MLGILNYQPPRTAMRRVGTNGMIPMPLTYAEPPEVRVTMQAGITGSLPATVTTFRDGRGQEHGRASVQNPAQPGHAHSVTCNSAWRETGEWWKDESEKDFYRVHGDNGFAAIIGRDLATKEWRLYQLND